MRFIALITIVLYSSFACAQDHSGYVVNAENQQPVPYANIGIINKNIGTVTDATGWFELDLDDLSGQDSIGITCIGFKGKKMLVDNLKEAIQNGGEYRIALSPKAYQLNEVIIKPAGTKIYMLGNFCDSNSSYGNTFHSGQLGTEIGVLMELPRKKGKAFLKSLRFCVGECTYDSFPVRVNIYELDDGLPGVNILREAIFIDINTPGEYIIPLSIYNITLDGDFFVSLEYYRVHKKEEGKLIFCAVHNRKKYKGNGFYRLASQGKWTPEYGDNLGISVEVECER